MGLHVAVILQQLNKEQRRDIFPFEGLQEPDEVRWVWIKVE